MSTLRPFEATDILNFNAVNVDAWTATYSNQYYASYLAQWPEWCIATEDGKGKGGIGAYMIAKHEPPAPDPQHHGHLTALSISPRMRALGLARVFMAMLERLSSDGSAGWGVGASSYKDEKDKSSTEPEAVADSTDCVDAWFVDLFVRCNNHRAIDMYERLGYSIFRRVVDYYHGMEGVGSSRDELDGFDMRKSMPHDTTGRFVRNNGRDILVSPDQVWS